MSSDEFEERLITEHRRLASRISELSGELKELRPRFEKISEAIKAYGLEGRLDRPEQGDDLKADVEAAATKGQELSQAAAELIVENGNRWTKLSDIYEEIVRRGIAIGGRNPNSTLSAHLSNSKWFESDRAKGWRLKELPPSITTADKNRTRLERATTRKQKLEGYK